MMKIHRQPEAYMPSPTEMRESAYAKMGPKPLASSDAM
jgi:hypothetical protein